MDVYDRGADIGYYFWLILLICGVIWFLKKTGLLVVLLDYIEKIIGFIFKIIKNIFFVPYVFLLILYVSKKTKISFFILYKNHKCFDSGIKTLYDNKQITINYHKAPLLLVNTFENTCTVISAFYRGVSNFFSN